MGTIIVQGKEDEHLECFVEIFNVASMKLNEKYSNVCLHIYFLINVGRLNGAKKRREKSASLDYLLMILNLSENNWKLFPYFFFKRQHG